MNVRTPIAQCDRLLADYSQRSIPSSITSQRIVNSQNWRRAAEITADLCRVTNRVFHHDNRSIHHSVSATRRENPWSEKKC
jgi:hypothetical protein